jgi:hypothetical protein
MKSILHFCACAAAFGAAAVMLTGCQAMYEQTSWYRMKQGEKARQAEKDYFRENFDNQYSMSTAEAWNLHVKKQKAKEEKWRKEHPGEPFYSLPWSSAPDAKRVEIDGKTYYCATTEGGDIHCE